MIDERVAELRPGLHYLHGPAERRKPTSFLDQGEDMEAELLHFAHIKAGADPGDDPDAKAWHGKTTVHFRVPIVRRCRLRCGVSQVAT
jgi:hypothetical protein